VIDPLGVDAARPALGWIPDAPEAQTQTAFRVIVGSLDGLDRDHGDRWDSGPVPSEACEGVPYAGTPLTSRERCFWKVRLWDRTGRPGPWSDPAVFEMGLLRPEDWAAAWIGTDASVSSPLLRTEFGLESRPLHARAYVSGLGYYELRCNGAKVGDRVLEPAATTYDDDPKLRDSRNEPTKIRATRVLYATHDLTDQLHVGTNAIGLVLGHGWYSAERDVAPGPSGDRRNGPEGRDAFGDLPRGLLQLEIDQPDGSQVTIVSDRTWRAASGPIIYNDLCHGERYDARLEVTGWDRPGFDDSSWTDAIRMEGPSGVLRSQIMPPIRVVETRRAIRLTDRGDGIRIADFGQHISGWGQITVSGPPGSAITMRHAGALDERGDIDDQSNMPPEAEARQTDVYVLRGDAEETWEPRFALHGFRYAELQSGEDVDVRNVTARVVHSDLERCGQFESSNELLNGIHANACWTFRTSFQGFPQDAAERAERVGWLGDPGFVIEDVLYNFDAFPLFAKWLDDIGDAQLPDGDVPVVCPLHWRRGAPFGPAPFPYFNHPDWKATYPLICWHLYRFTGDLSILERHYDGIRALLDHTSARAAELMLDAGQGDHMEPQPDGRCTEKPVRTPRELTSTALFYAMARIVADAADLLGRPSDADRYGSLATSIAQAFNDRFLDGTSGRYGPGTQTAQAVPLWLGLVPTEDRPSVARALVEEVRRHDGHLSTGIIGTAALEHALPDVGAADTMLEIATQTTPPGWGHQIALGATTIWESWWNDPPGSLNMKMFGSVEAFFFEDVAGLAPTAPGWRAIRVRPALTDHIDWARARVQTARGAAAIEWRARAEGLDIELEIPPTSVADVWLPARWPHARVSLDGVAIWDGEVAVDHPLVSTPIHEDGSIRFEIGGGRHRFAIEERR
jgi:alpha-L-rhamnosidase